MRKPWLAALLNVVPLGFGYAYLGRWRRFLVTFAGFPLGFFIYMMGVGPLFILMLGAAGGAGPLGIHVGALIAQVLVLLPFMLVAALTARDALRIARRLNTVEQNSLHKRGQQSPAT